MAAQENLEITEQVARDTLRRLGMTEADVPTFWQFYRGMQVETEHGCTLWNVAFGTLSDQQKRDLLLPVVALIALDHLEEIPDYYTRLDKMERDAFTQLGKRARRG